MLTVTLDHLDNEEPSKSLGHIFYLQSKDDLFLLLAEANDASGLTPGEVEFFTMLANTGLGDDSFISVKSLIKNSSSEVNRRYLYKRINSIVKKGFLIEQPFQFEGCDTTFQSKCFQVLPESQLKNTFLNHNVAAAKARRTASKNMVSKEQLRNEILPSQNIPPSAASNDVSRALVLSGTPPWENMVAPRNFKGETFITKTSIQGKPVIVELRSSDKELMYDEDLRTLYTLMTLSINQQANSINYYMEKQVMPINRHYIEIRHIMNALNKKSGGTYYKAFVSSIMRIKRSEFDLHQLVSMFKDPETGEDLFASPDFRFFTSCWPISAQGAVIEVDQDNNEVVKINPKGFIISWNVDLFNKMLHDNYFFVLPLAILSAPTPIFKLYVLLRRLFSKDIAKNSHEYDINALHRSLGPHTELTNYRRDLLNGFASFTKNKGMFKEDGEKLVDLLGYVCKITIKSKKITKIFFKYNKKKMLTAIGVDSNESGTLSRAGNRVAPTDLNPVAKFLPKLVQFKSNRDSNFPKDIYTRLTLPTTLAGIKHYKIGQDKYTFIRGDDKFQISHYSDNNEILKIAEFFHDDIVEQQSLFKFIESRRDALPALHHDGEVLSTKLFKSIRMAMIRQFSIISTSLELFQALRSQPLVVALLLETPNHIDESVLKLIRMEYMKVNQLDVIQGELALNA